MDHHRQRQVRRRKKHLRDMWIAAGLIMLLLPAGAQLTLALLATFLSFAYLDERPYVDDC